MDDKSHQTTQGILYSYYPTVKTLHDYVAWVTGENDRTRRDTLTHETDTLRYRTFIKETVIATTAGGVTKCLQIAEPIGYLREIIERAQITLLRAKSSTKNIITAGYKLGDSKRTGNKGLVNYFINTMITVFQTREWGVLYERVGADIMLHLLTETAIFVQLPNECLCQVTGEPLVNLAVPELGRRTSPASNEGTDSRLVERTNELKRKQKEGHPDEPPWKRLRVAGSSLITNQASAVSKSLKSPVQIPISRLRMFYRRPDRATRTPKIAFGLPLRHILNYLAPAQHRSSPQCRPDARQQEAAARHLSKYIFPRQYNLPNSFESNNHGLFSSEHNDREAQIKSRGKCKTPKRLKPVLDLLDRLMWRHSKCGYKPLLQRACPSKIGTDANDSLDETVILEMMAENSSQLFSQALPQHNTSVDSEGRTIIMKGLSQAQSQVKNKPRFAEFMCSYSEVFRFAMLVTKTVIPNSFWGSKRNFRLVADRVKMFITMRRYETFSLHTLLQGFRVSDCEWLMPDTPGARRQSRVCLSDSLKRLELLQEFLFWYFDSFLIPLIRTNFYVTESGAFRNKVLYFRQDDWDTLCKPLVERLCANTFQRLTRDDAEEILRQRKLGFSFVRLLPKETGVRPIVNLRRKKPSGQADYALSINQIMGAAFHILTYEKESQKYLLGASVFGQNEIYTKLKEFKTRLAKQSSDGTLPKLYFVKVDVQACFDTIEQTKLLEILRDILSEEEYSIQRHGQVGSAAGKIRRTFVKTAMPADDQPHFLRAAHKLAEALRHTIFVDQVLYPSTKRLEVLQLLEQHITDNIVKIGNNYYRQVIGIPQGSILSSLLCSFFYGDLEKTHLKFTDDPQSVLLRLIDDYLFVTTDLKQARKFLRVMNQGHPEYGCFISQDKTCTNFEDETMPNIVDLTQRAFSWCGFRIDMIDLSVSIDYSRFHETYLQDSLTVDIDGKPGAAFTQKMLQLAKSKSHIIFNDAELNSSHMIHRNVYENFVVTAMKMHYYLRTWRPDVAKSSGFLTSTIRQMIRYTYSTMRNKATNKVSRASGGKCEVSKPIVLWLGTRAFYTVLSCKAEAYHDILRSLEFDLGLPQYRRLGKRMKKVVKEGDELISVLSF